MRHYVEVSLSSGGKIVRLEVGLCKLDPGLKVGLKVGLKATQFQSLIVKRMQQCFQLEPGLSELAPLRRGAPRVLPRVHRRRRHRLLQVRSAISHLAICDEQSHTAHSNRTVCSYEKCVCLSCLAECVIYSQPAICETRVTRTLPIILFAHTKSVSVYLAWLNVSSTSSQPFVTCTSHTDTTPIRLFAHTNRVPV